MGNVKLKRECIRELLGDFLLGNFGNLQTGDTVNFGNLQTGDTVEFIPAESQKSALGSAATDPNMFYLDREGRL